MSANNLQYVFDKAISHLLSQAIRSSAGGSCLYRCDSYNGGVVRCAIGALIDDDNYQSAFEGKNIDTLLVWCYDNDTKLSSDPKIQEVFNTAVDELEQLGVLSDRGFRKRASEEPEICPHFRFLCDLQDIHDRSRSSSFLSDVTTKGKQVAMEYNLDWNFA